MRVRSIFLICCILILSGAFISWKNNIKKNSTSAKPPNIIFYLADDQDKYDYGCYGNNKVNTTAVDRLANEGVLFQNAFTGQAICAPSRSMLFTGNYPLKNGCFLNHIKTKANQRSVPTYLNRLGYDVVLAGKVHVKPKSVYNWNASWLPVKKVGVPRPYIPLGEIETYFETVEKPFCMFITSDYPHGPYFDVEGKTADDIKFYPFNANQKNDQKKIKRIAGYYRSIEEDNKQLDRILSWVDKHLDENTIFIYSADHGRSGKFTVYDRGLNVPFIVRWPNVIKPNTSSDVLIHYTDVLPTIMEIAGGEVPKTIDGKSFLQTLKGSKNEIHEYVYGVRSSQNIHQASVFPSRMIRNKKYKYIRNFNSIEVVKNNLGDNKYVNAFIKMGAEKFKQIPFEELYDIENDPYELENLAKKSKYRQVKKQLITDLNTWMEQQGDFLVKENYMPLLKPVNARLDETTKYKKVPHHLENTLNEEHYLELHY